MSSESRRAGRPGARAAGLLVVAVLATVVAYLRVYEAGVLGPVAHHALPSVLRTAGAALLLFALGGYGPARWLATGELRRHRLLLILPMGAAIAPMQLTFLGLLHVPFDVSLPVVLGAGGVLALLSHLPSGWLGRRRTPSPEPGGQVRTDLGSSDGPEKRRVLPEGWVGRIVLPLYLAALVAAVSLMPAWSEGLVGVPGRNGDAILVVGSAQLLEHAPPGAVRFDQPIDSVPLTWRSKYPLYYALAASARLAGQDPVVAFAPLSAVIFGLAALGFFLFVYVVLQGRLLAALLATFLVPLDRILIYVVIHPYYNELWGLLLMLFALTCGWVFLDRPSRRALALFGLFLTLALFAYPLVFPFPLMFLGTRAWLMKRARGRRGEPWGGWLAALGIPRPRQRPRPWIIAGVVVLPLAPLLLRGVAEKIISALNVLPPWANLSAWSGPDLPYLPFGRFFGMEGAAAEEALGLALVLGGLAVGLRHARPALRTSLLALSGGGLAIGLYFWLRGQGQLFYFKDLSFTGPLVLCIALAGVFRAGLGRRALVTRLVILTVPLSLFLADADREIDFTDQQADGPLLELRRWDAQLPAGSSVRIDIAPSGIQLWGAYLLLHHPVSTEHPLAGFLPRVPLGRKADYILSGHTLRPPPDAIPTPVLTNRKFVIYRMRPDIPGPDRSSRHLVPSITRITLS